MNIIIIAGVIDLTLIYFESPTSLISKYILAKSNRYSSFCSCYNKVGFWNEKKFI